MGFIRQQRTRISMSAHHLARGKKCDLHLSDPDYEQFELRSFRPPAALDHRPSVVAISCFHIPHFDMTAAKFLGSTFSFLFCSAADKLAG